MGCQPVRSELIERQLGARSPTERLQSQQTGERMGSRPSAAGGGGAPAPALRPADHRSTSKTQLLPGDRALLPPSPCGLKVLSSPVEPNEPPQDLTPASGRQDHTTSPYAATSLVRSLLIAHKSFNSPCNPIARKTLPRPPHPAPYVRDDRETPLCVGRDDETHRDVSTDHGSEIFLQMGLDSPVNKPPDGQIT